jgi:hypothetical protein
MDKEKLLRELRVQFDKTKERLGFKASFDDINKLCYIEDMALSDGFVSNQFSRQMINRMIETFYGWVGEMYAWLYPAPMDIIHMHESKALSDEEKQEIMEMIERIMYLVRKNKRIAFEGLIEEGKFVDELVEFGRENFKPFMLKYHKKFESFWKEEADKKEKNFEF